MTDRITYTPPRQVRGRQVGDNTQEIEKFVGGFPDCPTCGNRGEYETEYGPKACMPCVSRLLPIRMGSTIAYIDWGDTVIRLPDGSFRIEKGSET